MRLSSSEALLPPAVVLPPLMLRRLLLRPLGLAMALAGREKLGEAGGEEAIVNAAQLLGDLGLVDGRQRADRGTALEEPCRGVVDQLSGPHRLSSARCARCVAGLPRSGRYPSRKDSVRQTSRRQPKRLWRLEQCCGVWCKTKKGGGRWSYKTRPPSRVINLFVITNSSIRAWQSRLACVCIGREYRQRSPGGGALQQ